MKKTLLIIFFSFIQLLSFSAQNEANIRVIVSNDYNTEDQWVYLFEGVGNVFSIEDSVFLAKGQREFRMRANCKEPYAYCWLAFSKSGPIQPVIYLSNGDDVTVYIDRNTSLNPYTEGSKQMQELFSINGKYTEVRNKLQSLKEERAVSTCKCTNDCKVKKYFHKSIQMDNENSIFLSDDDLFCL